MMFEWWSPYIAELEAKKNDLILNFLQVSNRLNVVRNVSLKSIFWSEVPVAISELAARCHKLIFSLGEYKFSNILSSSSILSILHSINLTLCPLI